MAITIKVPATIANLGPGFDCLGLAVDLWNEVKVEISGQEERVILSGKGADLLPQDQTNAIFVAMHTYADYLHQSLPRGIILHCNNRIPLGSGLGSSAAAAVAGILIAEAILGVKRNLDSELACAAKVEGHPDNAAPCLLGGLVLSVTEQNRVLPIKLRSKPTNLIIVHPEFTFPTQKARSVLPQNYTRTDAIFNMNRALLLVQTLASGNFQHLRLAVEDRIHQPYRIPLIPGAQDAMNAAYQSGAAAVMLAGAGPSILSISANKKENEKIAASMQQAFLQHGLSSETFFIPISKIGGKIIRN